MYRTAEERCHGGVENFATVECGFIGWDCITYNQRFDGAIADLFHGIAYKEAVGDSSVDPSSALLLARFRS